MATGRVRLAHHPVDAIFGYRGKIVHYEHASGNNSLPVYVPRLPPLRAGFELSASHGPWQAGLRYTRALAQNRPGLRETSTDGYDRLDLDMSYDWKATNWIKLLLFGKASNMTQSVIRNSTSFLRNFAPEPGFISRRDFEPIFN